ncbi:hypothetical protein GCM10022255_110330 [Dactylosporangium darangshiense]|uniref:histidine kinase n=2 Tax=Dactylosporangium darangshiense TaxID=579108 RepID=A0ABP8DUK9_9ACTN
MSDSAQRVIQPVGRAVSAPETGGDAIDEPERSRHVTGISLERTFEQLDQLVEGKAALRHVAILVARGVPQAEIFEAVATELGRLIGADGTIIARNEADGTATVVGAWAQPTRKLQPGAHLPMKNCSDSEVVSLVSRTGRAARIDSCAQAPSRLADHMRAQGIRSVVGAPIFVQGNVWGAATANTTREEPLTADAEARLVDYTELITVAVANAQARADLVASRARVMLAADQTRRQIERDLHDGIQQRLVGLTLQIRDAQARVPNELPELRAQLSVTADGMASAMEDLREISRGIHPAILSEGGLRPALKALARRSAIAVELDVDLDRRLPPAVEVGAYYVVAETLTNAVKHAHASLVRIDARIRDGRLQLSICDDGIGGADPARGSGLSGLTDRVEALGGTILVDSPARQGTTLRVELPTDADRTATPDPDG